MAFLSTASTELSLPFWSYEVTSTRDNNAYQITAVGRSPFNRGARTTTVPVVIVPLILKFVSATASSLRSIPRHQMPAVSNQNTALSLTQNSPVFQNHNPSSAPQAWEIHNNLMLTCAPSSAARIRERWRVSSASDCDHRAGPDINCPGIQIAGSNATVYSFGGQCGANASGNGSVNANGFMGLVNIDSIDPVLQGLIATLGITPDTFPLFLTYNSTMVQGPAITDPPLLNCCVQGYHKAVGTNLDPGHTYGIAEFEGRNQTLFPGVADVSDIAHEIGEWLDDPGMHNLTPAWGNIGEVGSNCQNTLEIGDPLTGTLMPPVNLNGFTYHLQELAFFGWFYGQPPGVNGWYSSNGTFTSAAQACTPGVK